MITIEEAITEDQSRAAQEQGGKWYAKGRARAGYVCRNDHGVTRKLYSCTFVSEGFLRPPPCEWQERYIEFYALKPGKAVLQIIAAGCPRSLNGTIIN